MAQSLSDEEFQRMQNRLLELRTANYQLADQCKKQLSEISTLKQTIGTLEKDLQKANKVVLKSKKAQEYEILLTENEHMQNKMDSQEDDFRLQNSTMMQELSLLYDKNEKLEREKKELEEGQGLDHQAEIRRLQATNSVLQKNLTDVQKQYQDEIVTLKQTISALNKSERVGPEGESSSEVKSEETDSSISGAGTLENQPRSNSSPNSETQQMEQCNKIEELMKEVNELKLRADTEREENRMLKEQLGTHEKQYKSEISNTTVELTKLQEKLKKKQESFLQLQAAKDELYVENQKQIEDLKAARERELKALIEQNGRIQAELTATSQNLDVYQEQAQQKVQEMEGTIQMLQVKVNDSHLQQYIDENTLLKNNFEKVQQLHSAQADELNRFQSVNSTLTEELEKLRGIHNSLVVEKDDLQFQLTESMNSNSQLMEQLQQVQAEKETVIQDLGEATKIADNRKSMLDEMAIQIQTTKQQHMEQINSIQENNKKEQDSLREQLSQEKKERKELEVLRDRVPQLEKDLASTESQKGWFERRLAECEELLKQKEEEHLKIEEDLKEIHNKEIEVKHDELNVKDDIIKSLEEQIEGKNKDIENAKQETKDMFEEKKIAEKKGFSMVKDLKRQLHLERKRAEKLQERLQEILSENSGMKTSVDELFHHYNSDERHVGDSSSVSSWGTSLKDNSEHNQPATSEVSNTAINEETNELLARITEIQEQKWLAEERVNHLENSNACMADDLMKKSAIIQAYVMDRSEMTPSTPERKTTLHKMLDLVKGDESEISAKEFNKKLQRMLEETLTKNMHLQKDIEMLSDEIVRLSKLSVTANQSNNGQPSK
ncbi:GRIP1-associated protein 1-like [Saccoglossus kowalevskii]|uniref:GRIP1-associated protein 1-like n=1 Tax=Saccoglossus kowalevskii TaxID=10224 RepID=A0ABM0LXY1_SACKO|nr:PREDICTED: GRIP1-associated protein 1-like [Saccoglossus kowalevskii]